MMSRRSLLAGATSMGLASLWPDRAFARARTPYGGRIALHVPWPLTSIDPHRVDDVTAALFGEALFDTIYARDPEGQIVASLAEADPEVSGSTLRLTLRTDVRFASGTPLDARAAAAAIARARARDLSAWLADIPSPRVDGSALVFAMRDSRRLVRALASPMVAIVPPRFNPERPDGSGPLRAEMGGGGLSLVRNPLAASGPAFVDAIDIRHATDLATSLRAFESGADDVGWLGSFLHEPRVGAKSFDAGAVAWAIVRTGRDAGALDTRGTAQALADGLPHAALASLVVGPAWTQGPAQWTGGPCEMLVRDDAPWLVELARAVAVALSSPLHEVTPRPLPSAEVATRRAARAFALMLDVVRPVGPGPLGTLIGLSMADDPLAAAALVRHPPRGDVTPRIATRTMRLGVVGEVRLEGGRAPDLALPMSAWGRGVDWGSAFHGKRS